jgi:hypothetical protein
MISIIINIYIFRRQVIWTAFKIAHPYVFEQKASFNYYIDQTIYKPFIQKIGCKKPPPQADKLWNLAT